MIQNTIYFSFQAIYYFLCDYEEAVTGSNSGNFDNILFLYKFMYDRIHDLYKGCK